jgi:hypothetical protein
MKTYYFTATAHAWINAPDEQDDNEIVDMILEDPLPHIMQDPDIDINDLSVNDNGKWKWIIHDTVKPK